MSSLDDVASTHAKEFESLKTGKRKPLRLVAGFAGTALAAGLFLLSFTGNWADIQSVEQARRNIVATGVPWTRELSNQQIAMRDWLWGHGTGGEVAMFETVADTIFRSTLPSAVAARAEGLGLFSRLYVAVHFAVLRLTFMILACWRMWFLVVMWGIIFGARSMKAHRGNDLLGQCGNGRIFYSGIRQGLDKATKQGAPGLQYVGLACPKIEPWDSASKTALGAVLTKWGVANQTNQGLVGIITAYAHYPAYVATTEDEPILNRYYKGASLADNAAGILERTLNLHDHYVTLARQPAEIGPLTHLGSDPLPIDAESITGEQYLKLLEWSLDRVLTPAQRRLMAEWPKNEIATFVLASEAGKVLTHAYQGGKWMRRSNYPQLNARSMLHSLWQYAAEYDYDQRMVIRRAIIYGSRMGAFAPVHLPIDLAPRTRAGRQWMELLIAQPHELRSATDETELIGLLHEMHEAWMKSFMDGTLSMEPDIVSAIYATPSNLFFMPVTKVLEIAKRTNTPERLRRMEELVGLVNQKQRIRTMSLDFASEGHERSPLPAYARIFTPFSFSETKALSELHGVSTAELKLWSSVRVMFNAYGWLARRVGEHSVPESSVVFAVLTMESQTEETNSLRLVGKTGMIPLRATKLRDKWGSMWQGRFVVAESGAMAETREHYERLLKGLPDPRDEELGQQMAGLGI